MVSKKTQSIRPALWLSAWAVLLASATPSHVLAGDGVVEINQAAALAGGVTPGDTPGFPVELRQPGSYALSGDLDVGSGQIAILIFVDDVTLDLRGFTIKGPTTCSGTGSGVTCSAADGSAGILTFGAERLVVRNGSVRGFSADGISLGDFAIVENVDASGNRAEGVAVGDYSLVRNVTAVGNLRSGIFAGRAAVVSDSRAVGNQGIGIRVSAGGNVLRSVVRLQGGQGIFTSSGSLVGDNVAQANEGNGIDVLVGTLVVGNASRTNLGYQLDGDGGAATGYSTNVFTTAPTSTGLVSQGGYMATNVCNGATGSASCLP